MYHRSRNLKDILVQSYHSGNNVNNLFGSKGPKAGCFPCGTCVAYPNIERTTKCMDSQGAKTYDIRSHITCNTAGVIYCATCPCNLMYIGLTSRKLKIWVCEHCLDIQKAIQVSDAFTLKPLARHYKDFHGSNPKSSKVKGIDKISLGNRGGNLKKTLAQVESKWIFILNTTQPKGLNEVLSFAPFL